MNFKSIFLPILFLFVFMGNLAAQTTSTKYYYFDSNWELTTRANHTYFRKVEVQPSGGYVNPIIDYYRDGTVQCIIKADYFKLTSGKSFLESGGKNGEMFFYNQNAELTSYHKYASGQLIDSYQSQQKGEEWTAQDIKDGLDLAYSAWMLYKLFKGN